MDDTCAAAASRAHIFHTVRTTMKRTLSFILAALAFVGAMGSLAGCNTVAGAGQDLQRGGAAISREANEHKG